MKKISEVQGSLAVPPIKIAELPKVLPALTVSEEQFVKLTDAVIENLEGGYYHPRMKANFKLSDQNKLGDSGETLFGLDREHGIQLAKYPEWEVFWNLVDANSTEWKYNYKPTGTLGIQLRELASEIMYKWFQYLSGKYILISSMDEIANDERLLIHLSYGCWNGEGWFKKFASRLNVAVQNYEGDKEMIWREAIKARTESSNAVIRQQGDNMLKLFKKLGL